jgi:mRNA-degrading endonuclease RelE of RelBE toxin-antitoxin system
LYEKLPATIQELADKNFELLKIDPKHPSLHLKKAGKYWSARVGMKYRVLGVEIREGMLWFWIGTHAEYDKMLD